MCGGSLANDATGISVWENTQDNQKEKHEAVRQVRLVKGKTKLGGRNTERTVYMMYKKQKSDGQIGRLNQEIKLCQNQGDEHPTHRKKWTTINILGSDQMMPGGG